MGVFVFLAVLSILVFVHEAGHFFMAKRAGIRVLEFGFGLPPRIVGKKIGDTVYSLNLLPIGGFVRLFGEEEGEMSEKEKKKHKDELDKYAFFTQKKRVRVSVLIAGVLMNFILGVVIFSGIYTAMGLPMPNYEKVEILGVSSNQESPAHSVFELGDELVSVDGLEVRLTEEFQQFVKERRGKEVEFEVLRGGELIVVSAIPRVEVPVEYGQPSLKYLSDSRKISCVKEEIQEGPLGVIVSPGIDIVHYPLWQMPFRGAWYGLLQTYGWGRSILYMLGQIFSQAVCGGVPEGVGGPIEIGFQISEASKRGFVDLLNLMAILSINLAVINLLPIPALDGGRLMFIGIEAVIGRRVNPKIERVINSIGFALLLTLLALITLKDIRRHVDFSVIGNLFK